MAQQQLTAIDYLIHLTNRQNELLEDNNNLLRQLIAATGQHQKLGFSPSLRPKYIYCNRSQGGLWYVLADTPDRTPQPLTDPALTCLVRLFEFKQVERRGKDTWKLHLHVEADRPYILEAGYDSTFSRSLMSALAVVSWQRLQHPITIEVQAAESEEVLFVRVYCSGEMVYAPYDEQTNWRQVATQAKRNVEMANGR